MKQGSTGNSAESEPRDNSVSGFRDVGPLDLDDLQIMYDRRTELGDLAYKQEVSDAEVKARAMEVGKSSRTLWTWLSAFRVDGLAGLVPKKRSDAGSYHNISSDVVDLVRAIRLTHPDWSSRAVFEEAKRMLEKLGKSAPSPWQVRRICQEISPAVKVLADKRVNEFRNRYRFTYPREYSGVSFEMDHHRVDVLLRDMRQPKYRAANGEVRPWLTVVIDSASCRVIAYKFSYDPPDRHTDASVIRSSLIAQPGGIPDAILVDNGKDLVSSHVAQLVKALDIEFHICDPHQPQQRPVVERFFGTVRTRLWSTLPGYVSYNTAERNPSAKAELTLCELESKFQSFLDIYHDEVHESLSMSPNDYWDQNCHALPVMDIRLLDVLLLESVVRKVLKVGIKFGGRKYWHAELAKIVSQEVVIRADTHYEAPDEIEVYFRDRWLCTAFALDSERGRAVTRSEIAEAQRSQVNAIRSEIAHARSVLAAVEDQVVSSDRSPNPSQVPDAETSAQDAVPPADPRNPQSGSEPRVTTPKPKPRSNLLDRIYKKQLGDDHKEEK